MRIKIWQQCLPGPQNQNYFLSDAAQQLQGSERLMGTGLWSVMVKPILLLLPLHLRHISDFA